MEEQVVNLKNLKTVLNNLIAKSRYKSANKPNSPNRFYRNDAFDYECKNSNSILPDKSLVLNGVLCLHMTNYKLIMVDKTDWIYVQFSDCLDLASGLSQQPTATNAQPPVLLYKHLLRPVSVKCFNAIIESLDLKDGAVNNETGESLERKIFYVQADLKSVQPLTDRNGEDLERLLSANSMPADLKEGIWASLYKTRELERMFLGSHYSTFLKAASSKDAKLTRDHLRKLSEHVYLFRVVIKDNVKLLMNSQYKNKLRSDLIIEIKNVFQDSAAVDSAVLALMSKFLYYYNFLHVNRYYLLITDKPLAISPVNKNSRPSSIIFVDESFTIVNQELIVDSVVGSEQLFRRLEGSKAGWTLTSPTNFRTQNYVKSFTGTLLTKQLMLNQRTSLNSKHDAELMNHFDLLFSNRQFKLQIELEKSVLSNIDKFFDSLCVDKLDESMELDRSDSIITVYYDNVFSLFELSVLPGMQVQLSNLIKRSDRVFKSNSALTSVYSQPFDFLRVPPDVNMGAPSSPDSSISYSPLSSPVKPGKPSNPFESLNTNEQVFSIFYNDGRQKVAQAKPRQSFDSVRLHSLFKINQISPNTSTVTILGQIVKFYHLNVRLCCSECARFASSCTCGARKNCRVELDTSFLVDDHTSWLRVNYSSSNYDLKSKEHSIFEPISNHLLFILSNYVNEINLPVVPMQFFGENEQNANAKSLVLNALRNKLQQHQQSESYLKTILADTSNSFTNQDQTLPAASHTNNIAIHINKTVYDYLMYCVLEKYYQFTVETPQSMSIDQLTSPNQSNKKQDYRLAKLNDSSREEHYKSMASARCLLFSNVNIS